MIRSLERNDYNQWLPLWQENCRHEISEDVTTETWRRLCHPKENVQGLGVFEKGTLLGFLHYILHPTTGYIEPACYMQDLYIHPGHRRHGYARRLIWELHEIGKKEHWARLYWFADKGDIAAQNLYKTLGIPMNFSLHMLPTRD